MCRLDKARERGRTEVRMALAWRYSPAFIILGRTERCPFWRTMLCCTPHAGRLSGRAGAGAFTGNGRGKYVAEGRLVQVLEDWCPYWTGYHLCFPHHHQNTMPFSLFVEEMRHRAAEFRIHE